MSTHGETKSPLVVVFPRGQLNARDKERMTKAGIMAVEADDPKAVCQLHLVAPLTQASITGDAIVRAAVKAIALHQDTSTCRSFMVLLDKAISAEPTPQKD